MIYVRENTVSNAILKAVRVLHSNHIYFRACAPFLIGTIKFGISQAGRNFPVCSKSLMLSN